MSTSEKKTRGRQKIEMKKITNKRSLQVTFSKRRTGLFKKSTKLCTRCDLDMALILFSPSKKVFSFGHPNVEAVIERYLSQTLPQDFRTMQYTEVQRNTNVPELNTQLSQINNQLDVERKRGKEINRLDKEAQTQISLTSMIENMDMLHLEHFKVALTKIKKKINCHCDRLLNEGDLAVGAASTNPPVHQSFAIGPNDGMIHLHQPAPPQPPQVFPPDFFQGPMAYGHHLVGASSTNQPVHQSSAVGPNGGMIHLHQPAPPQPPQVFPPDFFQGPMTYGHHLVGASSTNQPVHQSSAVGPNGGMIPLHQPTPPEPSSVFPPGFFQGPMTHGHHLFGGFYKGGYESPPHGF